MSILIIDDDSRRPRQLRLILSCLGQRLTNVLNAGDLKAANALINKRYFEFIFLFIDIEDNSEFEAVHLVRARVLPSTKVFVYGPTPTRQHVLEARSAGASSFLVYPFTAGDVEEAIFRFRTQQNAGGVINT